MALTNPGKEWITQKIEESHQTKGWGRVGAFIRYWSLPSAAVTVILFALVQWNQYTQFRVHSEDRLGDLENGVKDIRASLDALRLKQNSSNPSSPAVIKETEAILESAQKTGLKISQDTIREEGTKFIHAEEKIPEAWQAVSAFLNYRSYLNLNFTPPHGPPTPVAASGYSIQIAPKIGENRTGIVRHGGQILAAAANAPPDKAARLETLQTFNVARSGPALLIVEVGENDAMVLDGAYIKNVIIRNTTVQYSGGPLVLDNVYFVNCSFELVPKTNSRQLADVILTSAAATFKAGA